MIKLILFFIILTNSIFTQENQKPYYITGNLTITKIPSSFNQNNFFNSQPIKTIVSVNDKNGISNITPLIFNTSSINKKNVSYKLVNKDKNILEVNNKNLWKPLNSTDSTSILYDNKGNLISSDKNNSNFFIATSNIKDENLIIKFDGNINTEGNYFVLGNIFFKILD